MYTKNSLLNNLKDLGIRHDDTLLVHSSMKAVGEVDGGAEIVLDALMEHLDEGLLVLPTHTWEQINEENNIFDPMTEPSCVGILTNLFLKRSGVVRSWHPTHSVAAYGKGAAEFVSGEELTDSPLPRGGCWGKLYDRNAKILFMGCSLKSNTILHGVEEWNNVPNRLANTYQHLKIRRPDGELIPCPQHRHHCPGVDISDHYDKIENAIIKKGYAKLGRFGDAKCYICDTVPMCDLVSDFLKRDPDLFFDDRPIPEDWY